MIEDKDWKEMKQILADVEAIFSSKGKENNDFRDVRENMNDIKKMTKEIEVSYIQNIQYLKEQIKVLTVELSSTEAEMKAPTETEHTQLIQQLIDKKTKLQMEMNDIRLEIDSVREMITTTSVENNSIRHMIEEKRDRINEQDSNLSCIVSLYSMITNISWHKASTPDRLKGQWTNQRKNDIQLFEIPISEENRFETANKLWEMIGDGIQ